MKEEKNIQRKYYGDEAASLKDFLIVLAVLLLLIGLDWIVYFKTGWLH